MEWKILEFEISYIYSLRKLKSWWSIKNHLWAVRLNLEILCNHFQSIKVLWDDKEACALCKIM